LSDGRKGGIRLKAEKKSPGEVGIDRRAAEMDVTFGGFAPMDVEMGQFAEPEFEGSDEFDLENPKAPPAELEVDMEQDMQV